MKIGFTGTRNGMTEAQKKAITALIEQHNITEAHHGDCIGSDAEFHALIRQHTNAYIVSHPGYSANNPTDTSFRAFCDADEVREPKTHFARNRDIVNENDLIFATPPVMQELTNGGTWYTINYAKGRNKQALVVYPDGSMKPILEGFRMVLP